jgi:hypothetical protein
VARTSGVTPKARWIRRFKHTARHTDTRRFAFGIRYALAQRNEDQRGNVVFEANVGLQALEWILRRPERYLDFWIWQQSSLYGLAPRDSQLIHGCTQFAVLCERKLDSLVDDQRFGDDTWRFGSIVLPHVFGWHRNGRTYAGRVSGRSLLLHQKRIHITNIVRDGGRRASGSEEKKRRKNAMNVSGHVHGRFGGQW